MSKLFVISNMDKVAGLLESNAPAFSPIEDLNGWSLLSHSDEKSGIDYIALHCEGGAVKNPLHSGGNFTWLGVAEEGPITLTLGDKEGKQSSSQVIEKGDFFVFEPDTYHGWIPMGNEAKLIFIKIKS